MNPDLATKLRLQPADGADGEAISARVFALSGLSLPRTAQNPLCLAALQSQLPKFIMVLRLTFALIAPTPRCWPSNGASSNGCG